MKTGTGDKSTQNLPTPVLFSVIVAAPFLTKAILFFKEKDSDRPMSECSI